MFLLYIYSMADYYSVGMYHDIVNIVYCTSNVSYATQQHKNNSTFFFIKIKKRAKTKSNIVNQSSIDSIQFVIIRSFLRFLSTSEPSSSIFKYTVAATCVLIKYMYVLSNTVALMCIQYIEEWIFAEHSSNLLIKTLERLHLINDIMTSMLIIN